jgi:YCII-related domain-containing protein
VKILYFYLMCPDEQRIRLFAPDHASYWRHLSLPGYVGGPFGDRTGGLITFDAASVDDADRLVAHDPFVKQHLVARSWVRAWAPG